jgi:CheY-like chemotaxis protein
MTKKKILIIDDETSITRTVKVNLEKLGSYVVRAENKASDALPAARQFMPDIIFLDVMMPEMDGGEVAALLQAEARLKGVPIVFLTAIVTKKETGEGTTVRGHEIFMAKPVNLDTLVKCIEEHT